MSWLQYPVAFRLGGRSYQLPTFNGEEGTSWCATPKPPATPFSTPV